MRSLLAVCLLVGCYKPGTESCYYSCAAEGAPCPSGQVCVAGNMCAAPGESCSIGGDAMPDSGPESDAPPPACGDGVRMPGEFCFKGPITFASFNTPFDGVLADGNGDGRLDLLFLTPTAVRFHVNNGTVLDPAGLSGQSTNNNARSMRPVQIDPMPAAELMIANDVGLESWGFVSSALTYMRTGAYPVIPQVMSFEVGKMTDGGLFDVILLDGSNLRVFRIDGTSGATFTSSIQVPISPTSKVVVGQLTNDLRSDVLLLSQNGITAYVGSPIGVDAASARQTPVTMTVSDAKIGKLDGDGNADIVFVVHAQPGGLPGQLGVMRGNGAGSFSAPQLTSVPDLGGAVEVVDVDGDGRDDVIAFQAGAAPQRVLLIYRSRMDGSLEPPVVIPLPGSATKISARGSFNGDTTPDIVVTDAFSSNVYVYPSNP